VARKKRSAVGNAEALFKHYDRVKIASEIRPEDRRVRIIPTTSWGLNHVFGKPGLPIEHIVIFYGPNNAGKTSIARYYIRVAQNRDERPALFVDVEKKLDLEYTARCGVNLDRLHIYLPKWGEDAVSFLVDAVLSKAYSVVVLDSVGALIPKAIMEGEVGDAFMGLEARLVTRMVKMLTAAKEGSDTAIILLNQTRANFSGFGFMKQPGGEALLFHSSAIVLVSKGDAIEKTWKGQKDRVGHWVKLYGIKNQVGPERRQAQVPLIQYKGIWPPIELLLTGEEQGIVKKEKQTYYVTINNQKIKLGAGLFKASREIMSHSKELTPTIRRALIEEERTRAMTILE